MLEFLWKQIPTNRKKNKFLTMFGPLLFQDLESGISKRSRASYSQTLSILVKLFETQKRQQRSSSRFNDMNCICCLHIQHHPLSRKFRIPWIRQFPLHHFTRWIHLWDPNVGIRKDPGICSSKGLFASRIVRYVPRIAEVFSKLLTIYIYKY